MPPYVAWRREKRLISWDFVVLLQPASLNFLCFHHERVGLLLLSSGTLDSPFHASACKRVMSKLDETRQFIRRMRQTMEIPLINDDNVAPDVMFERSFRQSMVRLQVSPGFFWIFGFFKRCAGDSGRSSRHLSMGRHRRPRRHSPGPSHAISPSFGAGRPIPRRTPGPKTGAFPRRPPANEERPLRIRV